MDCIPLTAEATVLISCRIVSASSSDGIPLLRTRQWLVQCSWNSLRLSRTRSATSRILARRSWSSLSTSLTSKLTCGTSRNMANLPCIWNTVYPRGSWTWCSARTTRLSCRRRSASAAELKSSLRMARRSSTDCWSCWYTLVFLPRSLCRSKQKIPSCFSSSRRFTTSRAAVFSLTNRTDFPSTKNVAIMLAIVWLLPVPGGPWITRLQPDRAWLIAINWLKSARSTANWSRNSRTSSRRPPLRSGGNERVGALGVLSRSTDSSAPAMVRTTAWSVPLFLMISKSRHMASLE